MKEKNTNKMAEILETNQMLGDNYEPKRKNRWVLGINGIDAFTAKLAARPEVSFEETVVDFINQKRYYSGKGTWSPISVTLYDPIVPSAAQKVMEWIRLDWENLTGRMGYKAFYTKNINLNLLDPAGAIVESWELQATWVQSANFGDLDYSSSDVAEIALTLRFDQAVLLF